MKVLVLVSGGETGAAAHRGRLLLSDLDCPVIFQYRSQRKLFSLFRFIGAGIAIRPSLLYVIDTTWTSVVAALVLKTLRGCRFVLDTGDAAYALARSAGRMGPLRPFAVWLVERIAIRMANLVVVRGSYHQTYLKKQRVKRVVEIPDCVALEPAMDRVIERRALALRRSLGLEGTLIVGMVGSCVWSPRLQIAYAWDLVEAMQFLDDVAVHAVVIGDGDGIPHLRRRIAELGLEKRVSLLGRVPLEAVNPYVRMFDVCLSTQTNDLVGWVRTTGKLPLYLANNRFVLATDVGQASYVLPPEMRIAYIGTVDQTYPARLAERIRAIARRPQELTLGSKGREIVRMYFDASHLKVRLADSLGLPRKNAMAEAATA